MANTQPIALTEAKVFFLSLRSPIALRKKEVLYDCCWKRENCHPKRGSGFTVMYILTYMERE